MIKLLELGNPIQFLSMQAAQESTSTENMRPYSFLSVFLYIVFSLSLSLILSEMSKDIYRVVTFHSDL